MPDLGSTQLTGLQGFPSKAKSGVYMSAGSLFTGLLFSWQTFDPSGGTHATIQTNLAGTGGYYQQQLTGATSGNDSTLYTNDFTFYRLMNPRINAKIRMPTTTASGRLYTGLSSDGGGLAGAGGFGTTAHGFVFGFKETDTNFRIMTNNGGGSAWASTDTGVAKDTNWHTVDLKMFDASASGTWQVDGGTVNTISTQFPGSTTGMRFYMLNTGTQTTASREGNLSYCEVEQN